MSKKVIVSGSRTVSSEILKVFLKKPFDFRFVVTFSGGFPPWILTVQETYQSNLFQLVLSKVVNFPPGCVHYLPSIMVQISYIEKVIIIKFWK